MADSNNPGQFGNRPDTEEQARKGGQASSISSEQASKAGKKGAAAQMTADKRKGGQHSRRSQ